MEEQGRLVKSDIYSFDGTEAVHTIPTMTPEELTNAYWKLYESLFTLKSIAKRNIFRKEFFMDPGKYLFSSAVNLYYRHQIKRRDYIFEFVDETNLKKLFAIMELAKGDKKETVEKIASIQGIRTRFNGFASNGIKGRNKYLLPNRESTSRYRMKCSYFGYKPAAIMEFGTGCEKGCEFCLRWRIEGSQEILIDSNVIRKDLGSIKNPPSCSWTTTFSQVSRRSGACLGLGIRLA